MHAAQPALQLGEPRAGLRLCCMTALFGRLIGDGDDAWDDSSRGDGVMLRLLGTGCLSVTV